MELTRYERKRITESGLTIEEYDKLARKGCSICGRNNPRPANIDRNPTTYDPIGALCNRCNICLVSRDPKWYRQVLDYLGEPEDSSLSQEALDNLVTPPTDTDPYGPDFKFDPTKMSDEEIKQYMKWANERDFG